METPHEIKQHKEVHNFYIFIGLVVFGILVLQPVSMILLMILQSSAQ